MVLVVYIQDQLDPGKDDEEGGNSPLKGGGDDESNVKWGPPSAFRMDKEYLAVIINYLIFNYFIYSNTT